MRGVARGRCHPARRTEGLRDGDHPASGLRAQPEKTQAHERPAEANPLPTTSGQCFSASAHNRQSLRMKRQGRTHNQLPQPVKGARFQRLWGVLSFGIIEQILLSGSSFVMTATMAHTLGPTEFGWFSIGWSIALLLEAAVMGLMGDSAPAIAHRLPANLRSSFRAAYLIISVSVSGVLLFVSLSITIILVSGNEKSVLLASSGVFFAQRLHNTIRRIYYLEGLRRDATIGALANVIVLALITIAVIKVGTMTAEMGLVCVGSGNLAAALLGLRARPMFDWPSHRLLRWTALQFWVTGRWVMASSVMSWLGNFGVIPLTGFILGPSQGGILRVIQILVVPLTQVNNILMSIIIPRIAGTMRTASMSMQRRQSLKFTSLLGGLGVLYSLFILIGGRGLFNGLFGSVGQQIDLATASAALFSYVLESFRYGCNIVLLSRGVTRILFTSQTMSLLAAVLLIPPGLYMMGVFGVVLASGIANGVNTAVTAARFYVKTMR
jgi:O-antigen/teichoic acid export membrane protein